MKAVYLPLTELSVNVILPPDKDQHVRTSLQRLTDFLVESLVSLLVSLVIEYFIPTATEVSCDVDNKLGIQARVAKKNAFHCVPLSCWILSILLRKIVLSGVLLEVMDRQI